MRRSRACALLVVLATTSVLWATPAKASYGVVVTVPTDPTYSPYGGPATATFTFDAGDPATVFTIRLRRPGHGTIREKDTLVDPATQTSPHPVNVAWPEITVGAPTTYVVDVRRQNGVVITSETFTLIPPLISDLSAAPSPFYPLISDGFKDHTTIGFSLAADTTATTVHIYEDDVYGRCCGPEIRTEDLGPLPLDDHTWQWDGTRDDASAATKGTYFVKVEATDIDALTKVSKAVKVEITRGTIRLTAKKEKYGSAYAKVSAVQQTALGGNCYVGRDRATRTASILCSNAKVSIEWAWGLQPGERIESASFVTEGGAYTCRRKVGHTKTRSIFFVSSPPTTTCTVIEARITYSYPVQA